MVLLQLIINLFYLSLSVLNFIKYYRFSRHLKKELYIYYFNNKFLI